MKQSLSLDAHGVMTIGQMCEAFDVTARTLRFYEQRNLIAPIREGQRRLFTARDRARLKLILRGKRFGFSLDDIQELLELYDPQDGQRRQLAATLERAVERLAAMQSQRLELDAAIDELKGQIGLVERLLAEGGRAEAAE